MTAYKFLGPDGRPLCVAYSCFIAYFIYTILTDHGIYFRFEKAHSESAHSKEGMSPPWG